MASLYVDKNHANSSDSWTKLQNSESQPWKTIRRATNGAAVGDNALQAASAGDTVYVKGNGVTYTEHDVDQRHLVPTCRFLNNGNSSNPIVIRPFPGHAVHITNTWTPSQNVDPVPALGTNGRDFIQILGFYTTRQIRFVGTGNVLAYCDVDGSEHPQITLGGGGFIQSGIFMDECTDCHVHHNYSHHWKGIQGNQSGIICWTRGGQDNLIEDNYVNHNWAGFYEKDRGFGNVWRRNYCGPNNNISMWCNNQNEFGEPHPDFDINDNVFDKGVNTRIKSDGVRFFNNLMRGPSFSTGSDFLHGGDGTAHNLFRWSVYNNVVTHATPVIWRYTQVYANDCFVEFDHNIYTGTPSYFFNGVSQTISFMRSRPSPGPWENNSETGISLASIYDASWNLKAPYTTRGLNGDGVGPRNASGNSIVATILDLSRYGPSAMEGANQSPIAFFSYSQAGLVVSVDGAGSSDADGTIIGYDWDWGDATAHGSGSTAQHTYSTGGSYDVELTVEDNDSATDSATQTVHVTEPTKYRMSRRGSARRGAPAGTRGVELWLPLRELAGVRLQDKSVNKHIATVRGAVWKPSPAGGCLRFDGVDDDVLVPAHPRLVFAASEPITLSAWLFLDTIGGTTWFLSKDAGASQFNYSFEVTSTGQLRFHYRNAASSQSHIYVTTAAVLTTGRWYHVACSYVYGIGTSMKMWVNGTQRSGSWTIGTGNDAPIAGNDSLYVGGRSVFGSLRLDGALMDVRILRMLATTGKIRSLMRDVGGSLSIVTPEPGFLAAMEMVEEESTSSSSLSSSSLSSSPSSQSSSSSSSASSVSSSSSSPSSSSSSSSSMSESQSSSSPSSVSESASSQSSESSLSSSSSPSSQSESSSSSSSSSLSSSSSSSSSASSSLSSESSASSESLSSSSVSSLSSSSSQSSTSSSSSSAESESSLSSTSSSSEVEAAARWRITFSISRV